MTVSQLLKIAAFAVAWPTLSMASPRIQTELPIYDLRQMITRFSAGAAGRATIGKIREDRFYPVDTYTMGALGATDCSALLDQAQAFPLEGMLKEKYIDQETHDALSRSARYLHADQVTFFSVLSYLSKEELAEHRSIISNTQLGAAPPRSRQDPTSVAVTVGSAYLVAGYRHTEKGIEKATMPWTKEACFADAAQKLERDGTTINFEMGRAMQVIPHTLDLNINAILISIAHEMAVTRSDFTKVRVFVHASKRANIIAYRRKIPSFEVFATDPNDPENMVLVTTLDKLYAPEKPWNYSASIQGIRAANPQMLTVPKVWGFLTALRTSGALTFDHFNASEMRSPTPILMRLPSQIFSQLVSAHTSKMGITSQREADQIVKALQDTAHLTSDYDMTVLSDHAAVHFAPRFEFSKDVIAISGLNAKESAVDEDYERKILISSVLQYREILRWADRTGIEHARYALLTTDETIANRLRSLKPGEHKSERTQMDWTLQNNPKGATFNFSQSNVQTFIFSFADIQRIANERPDLFKAMQERPTLRIGHFHQQSLLSRPTGL